MKYYLVVGEASGDLHGANLMKEIKQQDKKAEFRFWGGDLMEAEGGTLVRHYKNHDYMGVVEVLKHLKIILGNIKSCAEDIEQYNPDAVIFIDFPGFNLKVAPKIQHLDTTIFYYISPTVWAWKEKRVKLIEKYVDRLFVILPFVKDFYAERHNIDVDFVGHPLLDAIDQHKENESHEEFIKKNSLPNKEIIAVLPGSREYEIRENLKTMQAISDDFKDFQFVVAGMSRFPLSFYKKYIEKENVSVVFDQTYDILKKAKAAIVVSGSATLETAIIGTPEVLVYQTHPLTFYLGRLIVSLKFLGLPNLVMGKKIIPELLQRDMTPQKLKVELNKLVNDDSVRKRIIADYNLMREKLGGVGAAKRTASQINKLLTVNDKTKYYRRNIL